MAWGCPACSVIMQLLDGGVSDVFAWRTFQMGVPLAAQQFSHQGTFNLFHTKVLHVASVFCVAALSSV